MRRALWLIWVCSVLCVRGVGGHRSRKLGNHRHAPSCRACREPTSYHSRRSCLTADDARDPSRLFGSSRGARLPVRRTATTPEACSLSRSLAICRRRCAATAAYAMAATSLDGELEIKIDEFRYALAHQRAAAGGADETASSRLRSAALRRARGRRRPRARRMGVHLGVDLGPSSRAADRELPALHPQGGGGEPGPLDVAARARRATASSRPARKTADTYTWSMECPKANMRGTGSARLSRAAMEGETVMTGEVQGRNSSCAPKSPGERLGPCK